MLELSDILGDDYSGSEIILDSFQKANSVINNPEYKRIMCSVSGGGDSDVMLDLIHKVDVDHKVEYVWFDTGIEYQATKDHLVYLEQRYGINIIREKAKVPVPLGTKKYGLPWLTKDVSEKIMILQNNHFTWEDKSYEELEPLYKVKHALKWWCNENPGTLYNIKSRKWLKEFLIENPPTEFKISNQCCRGAKKETSYNYIKDNNIDLVIMGIRKAEGGIRATAYKTCFNSQKGKNYDSYRPLFWYSNNDKKEYEDMFDIIHSRCYTEYGQVRTGCAGCPYNSNFEKENEVLKIHEPKLWVAVNNIFEKSYEYTRKFYDFCKKMNS